MYNWTNRWNPAVLVVMLLLLLVSPKAFAGACTSADAPSAFSGASCNAGGANDICYLATGGKLVCGMARNGSTVAATGTMVANYNTGTNTYSGWGVASNGNNFCCVYSGANITNVEMYGGTYADTLAFFHDNGTIHRDLEPSGALFITSIVAYMSGGNGGDDLQGSFATTNYAEELFGDAGADTIDGNDGADVCTGGDGGDGDDIIDGGDGSDVRLDGQGGNDVVHGGDGDDFLRGGAGEDKLNGDDGDDTLEGDGEADLLCDANDGDIAHGGDGDDVIWLEGVGTRVAPVEGDGGTDECGEDMSPYVTIGTCESYVTTEPAACSTF